MRLIDSHAHLDDPRFAEDLDEVLERAEHRGIASILTVGCLGEDPHVPDRICALLDRSSSLFAAFGVHPHDARFMDERWERRLEELMQHPRVLALGEIGLDYYYDNSPREAQRRAFRRQVELAKKWGKPVIIHARDADEDVRDILQGAFPEDSPGPGVLHCFTGSSEQAEVCLRLGFYISFGGIVTFKKSDELRAIAAQVPADRLLIETDSPYLAPVPHRGKRNEPAFVEYVLSVLAKLREVPPGTLASQVVRNFEVLFRPPAVRGRYDPAAGADPATG